LRPWLPVVAMIAGCGHGFRLQVWFRFDTLNKLVMHPILSTINGESVSVSLMATHTMLE
jgi:hypothetical protein